MSIPVQTDIKTLEYNLTYDLQPVIQSGTAVSNYFDCLGMTLFTMTYPKAIDAGNLALVHQILNIPGGPIMSDFQTNTGVLRLWPTYKTSVTGATHTTFSFEPSLTGGSRNVAIVALDSAGTATQNETADRRIFVGARKLP